MFRVSRRCQNCNIESTTLTGKGICRVHDRTAKLTSLLWTTRFFHKIWHKAASREDIVWIVSQSLLPPDLLGEWIKATPYFGVMLNWFNNMVKLVYAIVDIHGLWERKSEHVLRNVLRLLHRIAFEMRNNSLVRVWFLDIYFELTKYNWLPLNINAKWDE